MVRTGYLRWEIEAADRLCEQDRMAREIVFLARPTYRRILVRGPGARAAAAAQRFLAGRGNYRSVERALNGDIEETEHIIPDVGPFVLRYSHRDRYQTPGFWITKVRQAARNFAHDVVRVAAALPQLLVESETLRIGYARLVEWETLRAVEGKTDPRPTIDDEPMTVEAPALGHTGIPELVAAELVRDVLDPAEFQEFSISDRVTVRNGGKIYRVSRRTHAMVDVWDAKSRRPLARLCVVFRDPGMPPSDEVVMKYLLARHDPERLWQVGNRFPPPAKAFAG
ncbi:MAG: hypothetical protein ACREIV_12030 [Planctomycetaceae bacterium]